MTTIRKAIHTARKIYQCSECQKTIRPGERYERAFGYAEPGDPPYEIMAHVWCICEECNEEIQCPDHMRPRCNHKKEFMKNGGIDAEPVDYCPTCDYGWYR